METGESGAPLLTEVRRTRAANEILGKRAAGGPRVPFWMGWTFANKPKHVSVLDFFKEEFEYEDGDRYLRILDCAVVGFREAYLAVERGDASEKEVFAVVCLLCYQKNDYFNFGYKDSSEDMHPYYYNCPERILKLLTSTDSESAQEWREKCWERIRAKKNRPRLRKGMVVRFAEPIRFKSGWAEREFRVEDPRRLVFVSGGLRYKLSRHTLENVPFEVVNATN